MLLIGVISQSNLNTQHTLISFSVTLLEDIVVSDVHRTFKKKKSLQNFTENHPAFKFSSVSMSFSDSCLHIHG